MSFFIPHGTEPTRRHTAKLSIVTRKGAKIELNAEILSQNQGVSKYIKTITLRRGINTPSGLTFILASIMPDDKNLDKAIKTERDPRGKRPTWKTIIKPGSKIEIEVNGEFKGVFIASIITKTTMPNGKVYTVQAIGMQEFLRRQSTFFDIGNEKAEVFNIFKAITKFDVKAASASPQGAIRVIMETFLFKALDTGGYVFSDGTSINDKLGLALSSQSYLGNSATLMQNFNPIGDYNIWDNIMKYQSPPFHEIWVTNGGRIISLNGDEFFEMKPGREYLVFRPTPYDDPVLTREPLPTSIKKIVRVGDEQDIQIHGVTDNFIHQITAFHVKSSNMANSDTNAFSFFALVLSGLGMDSNMSALLFPPLVDKFQFRYLGKKVFYAALDALDLSDVVKEDKKHSDLLSLGKSMQLKAYHWFKRNSDFNTGRLKTIWLENIAEGEHLDLDYDSVDSEETGRYYINQYTLTFDVEARNVEYDLEVTRGMPVAGFFSEPVKEDPKKFLKTR